MTVTYHSQGYPPPPPARKSWLPWLMLGIVVVVLFGAVTAAVLLNSRDGGDSNSPTPASLCQLLREGWTGDQLVDNDEWRSWPDSQSPRSRTYTIVKAANRGGCIDLL